MKVVTAQAQANFGDPDMIVPFVSVGIDDGVEDNSTVCIDNVQASAENCHLASLAFGAPEMTDYQAFMGADNLVIYYCGLGIYVQLWSTAA